MARKKLEEESEVTLKLRVTPRAKKNQIVSILSDNTIKIKLAAPPVEGKANVELFKYLSKVLGIRKSKIEIISGKTARDKIVSVSGLTKDEILFKLEEQISKK